MVGTPLLTCRPAGGAGTPFACSDLNACSIAALGTRDHHLLTGLADDDHSIYALLSGRSGGQLLKGGLAASEHLTLQSTAHANRGFVRAQDDLQLLSNILRDAAGTNRLQLATASPHLTLTGNAQLSGTLGLLNTAPTADVGLNLDAFPPAGNFTGIYCGPTAQLNANNTWSYALSGVATARAIGAYTGLMMFGLNFESRAVLISAVAATFSQLTSIRASNTWLATAGTLTITDSRGVHALAPSSLPYGGTIAITRNFGIDVDNQDDYVSDIATIYGIRVAHQTGGTVANYTAWFGPATPYLLVKGASWTPAANETPVWLAEGTPATSRQIKWKLYSALVAADKVMVLV